MQGRHIQLFNRLDALEIIHRTPTDSTKSILILDEEDHVDINNLHDKNIEYNTLLNVCYTVCKTLKENIRFVYLPISKNLFDKAWPKLAKKEWKGICFASDILSFGLANPLSDVIGCFFKADGHKCVLSVPLKGTLGTFTKGSGGPNTLGFFLKDLVQIASKPFHSLSPIKKPTIRMINTLDKFKKFMSILSDLKIVSIDTETSGLNRITSPLLMVQFATSNELCYCLPMSGHSESPWNDKELRYIKKYLRNYFSTTKSLHIMHAASFDIGQLMHHFNVKYYSANIYDTIAGEFCFDPDTLVETDKGEILITNLVDNPEGYLIKSYNTYTNQIEYKKILGTACHDTEDEMYELETEEGAILRVTENHKIWSVSRNMYVEIKNMLVGEKVFLTKPLILP